MIEMEDRQRRFNIHIIGVPEEEKTNNETELIFKTVI